MRGSGHIIEHDHWMIHPDDVDYLAPADRWCRVCAKPDREHVCSTCGRLADDPYQNPAADELCCDPLHKPFYTASQRIRYARFAVRAAAAELEAAKRRLRETVAAAAADGASLRAIGDAAGMSHEGIRKLLRSGPTEGQLRARLAELEARWAALVDRIAPQFEPPDRQEWQRQRNVHNGLVRKAASGKRKDGHWNGQIGYRGKLLPRTVDDETRRLAEREILRSLANHPEDPIVRKVEAELVEARQIRERLEALQELRSGF